MTAGAGAVAGSWIRFWSGRRARPRLRLNSSYVTGELTNSIKA